ncbi:hypothetical protein AB0F81_46260 [Actinoplanes sp. NPDC024001]|uniref:hypothetical protein n=1 Tax=Actinoplanes sp. NPDC024001 TaxID=3154598 RepID=UPI003402F6CE
MQAKFRPLAIAAAIVLVQAALVAFFAWPSLRTAPRDLPVVVTGPAGAAVAAELRQKVPGGFEITTVADPAAADRALRDREAYAAFVTGPTGVTLHVASAASPAVASLLTQQAQGAVVDVVPVDADDPRGSGLASAFLPIVLTSMVAGIVLTLTVASRTGRLAGVAAYATLAGLAGAWVLHQGYDILPGDYLASAGALALLALAVSATLAGLGTALGQAGLGVGALLVFLVGNPLSAVASAPELLPQPWGAIGQLLPPGAGATLLRSAAYFDGAGGAAAAWTLTAWAAVGLLLLAAPMRRRPAATPEPADETPALAPADA